jgi:hypothetical protein
VEEAIRLYQRTLKLEPTTGSYALNLMHSLEVRVYVCVSQPRPLGCSGQAKPCAAQQRAVRDAAWHVRRRGSPLHSCDPASPHTLSLCFDGLRGMNPLGPNSPIYDGPHQTWTLRGLCELT